GWGVERESRVALPLRLHGLAHRGRSWQCGSFAGVAPTRSTPQFHRQHRRHSNDGGGVSTGLWDIDTVEYCIHCWRLARNRHSKMRVVALPFTLLRRNATPRSLNCFFPRRHRH
ncbi:unnamed protein product, partial [Ectocarpus sp. 8 AP-2014]